MQQHEEVIHANMIGLTRSWFYPQKSRLSQMQDGLSANLKIQSICRPTRRNFVIEYSTLVIWVLKIQAKRPDSGLKSSQIRLEGPTLYHLSTAREWRNSFVVTIQILTWIPLLRQFANFSHLLLALVRSLGLEVAPMLKIWLCKISRYVLLYTYFNELWDRVSGQTTDGSCLLFCATFALGERKKWRLTRLRKRKCWWKVGMSQSVPTIQTNDTKPSRIPHKIWLFFGYVMAWDWLINLAISWFAKRTLILLEASVKRTWRNSSPMHNRLLMFLFCRGTMQ